MTALTTLVEPLKRELAVPGLFDDAFPDTDDMALAGALADGFSEAQLQGWFSTLTLGPAPDYETSQDISGAGGALVLIFTGMRILRAQLRTMLSTERYKAGAAEYEVQRSANLLTAELKFMQDRLNTLILNAQRANRAKVSVSVTDNYWAANKEAFRRAWVGVQFGAFYPYEYYDVVEPGLGLGLWS